jgi:uncharacterized protein VirK/YbjX
VLGVVMWKISAVIALAPAYICKEHLLSFSGNGRALKALSAPVLNPGATVRWLIFLQTNNLAQKIVHRNPNFLVKPLLRYISNSYEFADRVRVLASHYDFTMRQFSHAAWNRIYFAGGLRLAEFIGKSGISYRVILTSYSDTHNEGEMLLKIETCGGDVICFVIFSVGSDADESPRIELGAIQGARRAHPEVSKTATKDFHSMRPNHLLLAILYSFSRSCQIHSIICVNTQSQINRGNPSFVTDYDPFWEELGGRRFSSGFYLLPPKLSHRDGPKQNDKHASRHQRRAKLKAEIAKMMHSQLANH